MNLGNIDHGDEELNNYAKRIDAVEDVDGKIELIKEAMDYATSKGATVDINQLESVIGFAAKMVDGVLESIILTAADLHSDVVPVGFLQELRPKLPAFISQKMFQAVEELHVPLGGVDVPDDLSGIEL